MQNFEIDFIIAVQNFFGKTWRPFMEFISKFVSNVGGYIILLFFVYFCLNRKLGARLILLSGASIMLNDTLKTLIAAKRPYQISDRVKIDNIVDSSKNPDSSMYGMPSGHAQISGTIWGTLYAYIKKNWVRFIAVFVIISTGISRIYFGVHTLSQVIAGWLVAFILIYSMLKLEPKILSYLKRKKTSEVIWGIFIVTILLCLLSTFIISLRFDLGNYTSTDTMQALGLIAGFSIGAFLLSKRDGFQIKANWLKRTICFVLSTLFAVVIVFFIEKTLLDSFSSFWLLAVLAYSVRAALGFVVAFGLPAIFQRLGLNNP